MSLNSINTNINAMVALNSLEMTNTQLAATQKQISTGYSVADATDNGAAYAVAQGVRADVGGLTSANQQLGNVQGLLSTTLNSLNTVSTNMNNMLQVMVKLADGNTTGNQRTQYISQYQSDLAQVKSDIQSSAYNGKTLVGNITGSQGSYSRVAVIQNEVGTSYGIASFSGSALLGSMTFTSTQMASSTAMAAAITTGGIYTSKLNLIGTALNTYGNAQNYVTAQQSFNSGQIDALNAGLGSLIDANMAQESAQLTALQIRQQLGTQALSMANQAPQSLLSLFR